MGRPARQTFLRILPAALLVAGGALSLGAQRYVFPADAEPSDWKPAAAHVRNHVDSKDVIRTHPPWNVDALPYLESLGDQVQRIDHPVESDLDGREDVWILSEAGRIEGAIDRLPFQPDSTDTRGFGDVAVVRAEVPDRLEFNWEALENLSDATVERLTVKGGSVQSVQTCEKWSASDRRWDCGSRDKWLYVGETFRFVGGAGREVVWAHPLPKQKHLRITFPDVPLGDLLRVRAGYTFMASRHNRGKPVRMEVRLDGETQARRTYPILESTWEPIEVDTSGREGETGRLTVEIWSPAFWDRYFCFNAWTR